MPYAHPRANSFTSEQPWELAVIKVANRVSISIVIHLVTHFGLPMNIAPNVSISLPDNNKAKGQRGEGQLALEAFAVSRTYVY